MKRILLKISGEALSEGKNIYNNKILDKIANEILNVRLKNPKLEIAIVIGGGNIWRGGQDKNITIPKPNADYMGMLATIMNGIALKEYLKKMSISSEIFSPFNINQIGEIYNIDKVKKFISSNKIAILSGGTGSPFFTTDTCASLRAMELSCDHILMAKNGVDGVYDSDPKINNNAKFIPSLSYNEIVIKKLKVIDTTAAIMLQNSGIKTIIFNIYNEKFLENVVNKKNKFTTII